MYYVCNVKVDIYRKTFSAWVGGGKSGLGMLRGGGRIGFLLRNKLQRCYKDNGAYMTPGQEQAEAQTACVACRPAGNPRCFCRDCGRGVGKSWR